MKPKYSNRLLKESSPYLKQHGHNPVDWFPWGFDALEKAKREEKPIFLSIGYSACHWCHVMERESFENEETAKILNEHFVSIKVDREERPDLDHIYMSAVQLMTQHGGWPMSVFLTPELKPFYGGTYFPPEDRMGMPSFQRILTGIVQAWKSRKAELLDSANQLVGALKEMNATGKNREAPTLELFAHAVDRTAQSFDSTCGGIGNAPKFFHTMDFRVCLRYWRKTQDPTVLQMVKTTLDQWTRGGIKDQLGGGFHRYSTDRVWLVPHFEKMLYDNALVTQLYLEAYQATGHTEYSETARETLDFILSDMTSKQGPYFSTLDADSEGVEGKYYVWSLDEVKRILKDEVYESFIKVYNISESGNWEETNIPHRTKSWEELVTQLEIDRSTLEETIAVAKRKLLAERKMRVPPFLDEKVLTNWNGLMIETMALASQVLGDSRYLESAEKAARFLLKECIETKTSTLQHAYKDGFAQHGPFLDDYAALINGLIALYEATFDRGWLIQAEKLTDKMMSLFWDANERTFFFTAQNQEALILRPKEFQDGATPSATGLAVTALSKLGRILCKDTYLKLANQALSEYHQMMQQYPHAASQLLIALDILSNDPIDVVVAFGKDADENQEFLETIYRAFIPNRTLLKVDTQWKSDHFEGKNAAPAKPVVYLCRNFSCQAPIENLPDLKKALGPLS